MYLVPTQALLLLHSRGIDHDKMRMWIIKGLKDPRDTKEFETLVKRHLAGEEYIVSYLPEVINESSVRRHFENKLALHVIQKNLALLPIPSLSLHIQMLCQLFPVTISQKRGIFTVSKPCRATVQTFIDTNDIDLLQNISSDAVSHDFRALFCDLKDKTFLKGVIPDDNYEKLLCVMKINLLVMFYIRHCRIEGDDPYECAPYTKEARGRQLKEENEAVCSLNMGLLKSYMPAPYHMQLSREDTPSYTRGSDYYSCRNSGWALELFEHKVYPFSASISGVMLCQIKMLCLLFEKHHCEVIFHSVNYFKQFFLMSSSLLLLHDGGHSYYEFFAPFMLPYVKKSLPTMFSKFING